MSLPSWTPERVATLERLWTDGFSASEIAARLPGTTRNAVLGKLYRIGRLGRGRPTGSAKSLKVKPASPPAVRRLKTAPVSPCRPSSAPTTTWPGEVANVESLRPWHCRWPIGDPRAPGFAFCGRRAAARPYCEEHRAAAYQPSSALTGEVGAKGRGRHTGPS